MTRHRIRLAAIAALVCVTLAGAGGAAELSFLEAVPVPDAGGGSHVSPVAVAVSPDGAFVYVLTDIVIGTDAVQIYHRESNGALTYVDTFHDPPFGNPTAMALAPDGTVLFVVDNNGGVYASRRDDVTGLLTWTDVVYDGASPNLSYLQYAYGVAVSPDGKEVFVGSGEHALTSLAWDPVLGKLAFADLQLDGDGDVQLLADPTAIASSPDGLDVVVAAVTENGVTIFDRNPATGSLSWNHDYAGGPGGLDGLYWPTGLVAAPTGLSFYASGRLDGKVARFVSDEQGNVVYADGVTVGTQPFALALHPTGLRLYVTDFQRNAVTAVTRDLATGALVRKVGEASNGVAGVSGLAGPRAMAVSPDGTSLYVCGSSDETVAVFQIPAPEPSRLPRGLAALGALLALGGRAGSSRGTMALRCARSPVDS